jgi:hypothetical protein
VRKWHAVDCELLQGLINDHKLATGFRPCWRVVLVFPGLLIGRAFTQPVSHAGSGATVLYYGGTALFVAAWLVGAVAVWLLWRPASSAFFKPHGLTQARPRHS